MAEDFLLNSGTKSQNRPLKVFTWHIHGSYLFYLSQGDYELYIPELCRYLWDRLRACVAPQENSMAPSAVSQK